VTGSRSGSRDVSSGPVAGASHFPPAAGPDRPAGPVCIDLSADQVDQVVRAASHGGTISVLLSGLEDVRALLAAQPTELENPRLSRSLLFGLLMLAAFPADGGYVALSELARRSGRSSSTAHRYVCTLIAVGLVERDPRTRAYRLAL